MDRNIDILVNGEFLDKSAKNAGVQGEGNVTSLTIVFDESWDGYGKRIIWYDALGENPVGILLGPDKLIGERTYVIAIPAEPLAVAGWCSFSIDGYYEDTPGEIAKTVRDVLEVKPNYSMYAPAEPSPSQAQQLQEQIEKIVNGEITIVDLVYSKDIRWIRKTEDDELEVSADGVVFLPIRAGHVILDGQGNTLPKRTGLQFTGTVIRDDETGDRTVVQGIQGETGAVVVPWVDADGMMYFVVRPSPEPLPEPVNVRGPQGLQGVQGAQGEPGVQGPQGVPGMAGMQGPRGYQGEVGPQGPVGIQGVQGPQGPQGMQGHDGADGRSFTILALYPTLAALQMAHPVGNPGDAYAVGTTANNTIYLWDGDAAEYKNIGALQGPQGPQGQQGIQGPQGPQGEMGVAGPEGPQGPEGAQGPQGMTGQQGIQGVQGVQGPAGAAGKSAYASAISGGYSGTEAQFNSDLKEVSGKAPINHAASAATYGAASGSMYGHAISAENLSTADQGSFIPYHFKSSPGTVDLNSYRAPGFYTFYSVTTATNFPPGTWTGSGNTAYLEVKRFYSDTAVLQILYKRGTTEMWMRYSTSATAWSTWEKVTAAADAAAAAAQSAAAAAQTTANAAMPKTGGTFTGQVYAADSATTSKRVRNIQLSTTDLTAGSSSLASGVVYLVYE